MTSSANSADKVRDMAAERSRSTPTSSAKETASEIYEKASEEVATAYKEISGQVDSDRRPGEAVAASRVPDVAPPGGRVR